jgi:hypothetical protein
VWIDLLSVRWGFWIAGTVGVVIAGFRVWMREDDGREQLAEQLRPHLEIETVPEVIDGHGRVRVRNRTRRTIRFAARLVSVTPNIGYPLPVYLRHTHHPPQHEAEIQADGTALVDVFVDMGLDWLGLLVMGNPPDPPHQVARNQKYEICVAAFPTTPHEGPAAYRRFYIRGEMGGPLMFSDAGVPPEGL